MCVCVVGGGVIAVERIKKKSRAPNPPEFAQPRLSRAKMPQIKHIQICNLTPGQHQPSRNKHPQIRTLLLGMTYSNGAVQIRVGLESADPLWQAGRIAILEVVRNFQLSRAFVLLAKIFRVVCSSLD